MEIRKSLEVNFLTCKYCHQPYRRPKVLLCLHTFCQVCLEELFEKVKEEKQAAELDSTTSSGSSRYYSDYRSGYRSKWSSRYNKYCGLDTPSSRYHSTRTLKCPVCDKETAIPSEGISGLPTDQLADKLASMVDRMPTFPICDVCTKKPLMNEPNSVSNSAHETFADAVGVKNAQSQFIPSGRYPYNRDNSASSSLSLDCNSSSSSSLNSNDGADKSLSNGTSGVHRSRSSFKQQKPRRRGKTVTSRASLTNGPMPAEAACLECAKRLCAECRETHARMPVTLNHVLVKVEQIDDLYCQHHPRELRRLFCNTCRSLICIVCTFEQTPGVNGHVDHEIMSIRESVDSYQTQLTNESVSTQAFMGQVEALASRLQLCEYEMKAIYASIDETANHFIEQIRKQQVKLNEKVDQAIGISLAKLSGECGKMLGTMNKWYDFLNDERVACRLDLMDPMEALVQAGPLLDRLRGCLEQASRPLVLDLQTNRPFLHHLEASEQIAMNDQERDHSWPNYNDHSSSDQLVEDPRSLYWRECLGLFQKGSINLGRVITKRELLAEANLAASQRMSTATQTGPELVKSLLTPKGSQRHRAVHVNLIGLNLVDNDAQTDSIKLVLAKASKVDAGTQYKTSDFAAPISMYRSHMQMLVQK